MQDIAIIGAGIAGLTAAHALKKAGHGVRIFERADTLRALGSGITMQANAMAAYDSLGLAEVIEEAGYAIRDGAISTWEGKVINGLDIAAISESTGRVGVAIHRGRLLNLLAEGLEGSMEYGASVAGVENVEGGAEILFDDGRKIGFAAVIGCDGLHSFVRRSLFGEEPLRYAGYTSWRGIARMPARDVVFGEYWGPGRRFGLVPIAEDEVYWFAVDKAPAGQTPTDPVIDEVRPLFADWNPLVVRALEAVVPESVIRTDCHDRPPLDTWGKGCITLLGDAAHPMTPNLGQGGGQAVESAVVLGRALTETSNIEEGLRRYEALRRPRAHHFVNQSWQMGQMAQWESAVARGLRDFGLRLTPASMTRKMLRKLYDFEGWYASAREG